MVQKAKIGHFDHREEQEECGAICSIPFNFCSFFYIELLRIGAYQFDFSDFNFLYCRIFLENSYKFSNFVITFQWILECEGCKPELIDTFFNEVTGINFYYSRTHDEKPTGVYWSTILIIFISKTFQYSSTNKKLENLNLLAADKFRKIIWYFSTFKNLVIG